MRKPDTLSKVIGHHSRRFWEILTYRYLSRLTLLYEVGVLQKMPARQIIASDRALDPRIVNRLFSRNGAVTRQVDYSLLQYRLKLKAFFRNRDPAEFPTDLFRNTRSFLGGFHYRDPVLQSVAPPAGLLRDIRFRGRIQPEHTRRRALNELAEHTHGELERLALKFFPRTYVEEFRSRFDWIHVIDPNNVTFHASFLDHDEDRFVIARYVEEGSQLHLYQHACGYGEYSHYLNYHVEGSIADHFHTWGWKIRPCDSPYFALRLMGPQATKPSCQSQCSGEHILYVQVRPPHHWNRDPTISIQEDFLTGLSPGRRKDTIIRTRNRQSAEW